MLSLDPLQFYGNWTLVISNPQCPFYPVPAQQQAQYRFFGFCAAQIAAIYAAAHARSAQRPSRRMYPGQADAPIARWGKPLGPGWSDNRPNVARARAPIAGPPVCPPQRSDDHRKGYSMAHQEENTHCSYQGHNARAEPCLSPRLCAAIKEGFAHQ